MSRLTVFGKLIVILFIVLLVVLALFIYRSIESQQPYVQNMYRVTSKLYNFDSAQQVSSNVNALYRKHEITTAFYNLFNVSRWVGVLPKYVHSTSSTFKIQSVRSSTFLDGEQAKVINLIRYVNYQTEHGTKSTQQKIEWLEVNEHGTWKTQGFEII